LKQEGGKMDISKIIVAILIAGGIAGAGYFLSLKYENYIWALNKRNQIEAVDACFKTATLSNVNSENLSSESFDRELYKLCMQDKGYQNSAK
jgi:hypothetical protein